MAYGPKVSDSALAMGNYSFWNQAGRFPTVTTSQFGNEIASGGGQNPARVDKE